MNERHPVDDLFARTLRDAEAEPPVAVWDGIMQKRGSRRRVLLLLRRRWGALALIFISCGLVTYGVLSFHAEADKAVNNEQASTVGGLFVQRFAQGKPAIETATALVSLGNSPATSLETAEQGNGPVSLDASTSLVKPPSSVSPRNPPLPRTMEAQAISEKTTGATMGSTSMAYQRSVQAASTQQIGSVAIPSEERASDPTPVDAGIAIGNTDMNPTIDVADRSIERLRIRAALADRPIGDATPVGLSAQPLPHDRIRWWIGLDAGSFAETRKWHGGDLVIAQALNGTQRAHPVWGTGLSAGLVNGKGWGLSFGVMYCASHSEFRHVDHVLAPMDSLVPYVVTFNDQVIDTYTETVTVLAPAQEQVAVENRYSTFRIPIEVSWQQGMGRWKYKAVIGAAVEFNTMLSGATLERCADGNVLSTVDVQTTSMRRTTALMTGSVALEVGYALTEDWQLWAGPSYATGLFPLSPKGNYPYAMPQRPGVQARLCYMLRLRE